MGDEECSVERPAKRGLFRFRWWIILATILILLLLLAVALDRFSTEILLHLDGRPRRIYYGNISSDEARKRLNRDFARRWSLEMNNEYEVVFAARDVYHEAQKFLLKPTSSFNYVGFRQAIRAGGVHRNDEAGIVDDDDKIINIRRALNADYRKEGKLPGWWKPEELNNPDYIGIHLFRSKEEGGPLIWCFIISEEDGLIYIFQNTRY